jgi:hypothetical protein
MALQILRFRTMEEANYVLRGGIIGGQLPQFRRAIGYLNLVGNTITFTTPAGSHEFTQVATEVVGTISFAAVKTQLEANITNLLVDAVDGKIGFRHATLGTNVNIASADEPTRIELGFANEDAHVGQFINADGVTAPFLVSFSADQEGISVTINE